MRERSTFHGGVAGQIPQVSEGVGGKLNSLLSLAGGRQTRTMIRVLGAMLGMLLIATSPPVQAQSGTGSAGPGQSPPGLFADQNSPQSFAASIPPHAAAPFQSRPILSLPEMFVRQWTPRNQRFAFEEFKMSEDNQSQKLTLKETIFLALKHNPGLASVALDPVASTESVRAANAIFDPQLSSQIDVAKQVTPVSSPFQNPNSVTNTQKFYDWNFGMSKVLSTTNGTLGLTFNNDRELTNSSFSPVNPVYTPTMVMSLSQPLLQNFGWRFATINVRLAESAQRVSQWNYASSLNDFVQRIGNDYWGIVQAQENLKVQQSALEFNNDLVRVNGASVRIGMMAPVNLSEALSAAATARANVQAAVAGVDIAEATLRQDVAFNPARAVLAQPIEPAEHPDTRAEEHETDQAAFERMIDDSPSLAGLRESIVGALIQVRYAENQTLPQLNLGVQFGITSEAGNSKCTATITVPSFANCFDPSGPKVTPGQDNAAELPFNGGYGSALNGLWNFAFYDYAAVLGFSIPLDNAAPQAALSQARISLEQNRLQYQQALYQAALQVKAGLSNLHAYQEQVESTAQATSYAAESLRDVQVQFRVGTATTNQLLQYQSNLVTAQGNEVQSDVGLENARLALWHAEGTLLGHFNINFEIRDPHQSPWYSRF
ncbi:MAG: TolC family protein [Deltaproteobacteria bacterium]|nr:TolC family protein [Deltaproteobacteria bacterium]